jgi:predicted phage replisome organizer
MVGKDDYMAEVKWIKITTTMFDDEKIKLIEKMPEGTSILLIWIKLLTLAGKCNATGQIYLSEDLAYTDEMLSIIFNMPLSTVRLALQTFNQFGMVDISESHVIKIVNWEKHQNIQGLDKIREQNRLRNQRYRENQKQLPNVTVTSHDAIDKNKNKSKKEKKKDIYISCQHLSMTEEEYKKLVVEYGEELVKDKLIYAENYAKLKNYKSLYLTLSNWLKADKKKEGTNGTNKQLNGQDKPHFKLDKSFYATSNP